MSIRGRQYADLVPDERLRDVLADAFEVIAQIAHPWSNSGHNGQCARCGLPSGDVWHRQVRDMVPLR